MDAVRFTDILTTALSVANYLRAPAIEVDHMKSAIALLDGSMSPEDLGPPQSFMRQVPGTGPDVAPAIASVVQRWWQKLSSDPLATLSSDELNEFRLEVEGTVGEASSGQE